MLNEYGTCMFVYEHSYSFVPCLILQWIEIHQ